MSSRPLLWSAAAFVAGILIDPALPGPCCAAIALALLAGALCLCSPGATKQGLTAAFVMLLVGMVAAGGVAAAGVERREPYDIATLVARHPEAFRAGVEVAGVLSAPPRRLAEGEGAPAETELLVDLDRVRLARQFLPAEGRVRLRVPEPRSGATAGWHDCRRGARVNLFARLWRPEGPRAPGSFDHARYLRGRGIQAVGSVKSARLIERSEPARLSLSLSLLRGVDRLRDALLARLEQAFDTGESGQRAAAFSAALLLGERRGLRSDDLRALQEAGLTHLLAVSGFNVAVLAWLLTRTSRSFGVPGRAMSLLAMPALLLYLLLNREESSVARAVIMAAACLAGRSLSRHTDLPGALGLSALVILAVQPLQAHEPGFQLTYAATLSLIGVTRLLPRPLLATRDRPRYIRWPAASLWALVAGTASAMLGTLPMMLIHFHRVTPAALPANLVAGPLTALSFVLTIGIESASCLSSDLARSAGWCVTHLVETIFVVADVVRVPDWAHWRAPAPPGLLIGLYYSCLLVWALSTATALQRRRVAATATLIVGMGMSLPIDTRPAPEGLRVTLFDVGQGDSILIETPSRRRLLVDAGGNSGGAYDVGERMVSVALWHAGIARLDVVALTHDDADHIGGAASVVRNFRPRQVWLPAGASRWADRPCTARLRQAALEAGASLVELAGGDRPELPGARVEVLGPPAGARGGLEDNDRSLILALRRSGRLALLPGDAGARAESLIAECDLRTDLLKVAHHGSRSSSTESFLAKARPRVAAISCGRGNRFGHPSAEVLARLSALGSRVCRTDRHGTLSVELLDGPSGRTRLSPSCALGPDRQGARAR